MAKPSLNALVDSELAARFSLGMIELFQAEASLAQLQTVLESAFQWADYCVNLIEAATPLPQPLACQPGCNFCCYNQVELTGPEALRLGSFLTASLSPENLQLLRQRVERSLARRDGQTKVQLAAIRADLPCPLLVNGKCLAYDVRPLMCRAMHSLDTETCRQEFTNPGLTLVQFYSHRHVIHVSLSQGLIDGCLALGYQSGPVDLLLAIQQYLSQPDLAERWLAGKKVFHAKHII
jgi:Fe-S-cluster containining protein